ncbi:OSTA protein, partial [Acromyrmex heyeri]
MDNSIENVAVHTDVSCNPNYVPSAIELVENLNALGTVLLSVGSIVLVLTIYLFASACSLLYFILLYVTAEDPTLTTQYITFLQPVVVISLLLGIYSLTITTKTLHTAVPEVKLHYKTLVLQLVLLFSKLQTGIIKALPAAGVFPCNPPLTPEIYANVTCNALILIEMMVLCYAAWYIYYVDLEKNQETDAIDKTSKTSDQVDVMNSNDSNKQFSATVEV